MNNKSNIVIFFVLLGILFFYFEYNYIIGLPPKSFHQWRQADCASFAMRYYHGGMHFFEPKVNNVLIGEGNCAGECPIIYYLVAILYKIFGVHDMIFRLTVLLFLLFGLISLNQLVKRITNDYYFALVIPLLFFSSPLIVFFGNNFLSDVPALSCVLIALNLIDKYRINGSIKLFFWSMFFFTLAGVLKLNSIICLVALATLFFIEINSWALINGKEKFFRHPKINFLGFLLAAIFIASWYQWAILYNEKFHISFLGTQSWPGWPIWEANDHDFLSTMTGNFAAMPIFFSLPVCAMLIFLFIYIISNLATLPTLLKGLFILCLTGAMLFFLIFFVGFRENTYYAINLMIVPILAFICSVVIVKQKYPAVFSSIVFRVLVFLVLFLNVYHAKSMIREVFYHGGTLDYWQNDNLYPKAFRTFIDSVGIGKNDKVISMPDPTPNYTLYLIDRQGWTNYNIASNDLSGIENCIKSDAKYLIVSDLSVLKDSVLRIFTQHYLGRYKNIFIYKLSTGPREPVFNNKVSLKAYNNKFVSLKSDGQLKADKDVIEESEKFTFVDLGNNLFYILTANSEYVTADLNQEGLLHNPQKSIGEWEIFSMQKIDSNHIAIKGCNNKYVTAEISTTQNLAANRDHPGEWESFTIVK